MKRSLGLAAIALGCSMGIAMAQPPSPPTPQQEQLLKGLVAEHAAAVQNGLVAAGAVLSGSKAQIKNAIVNIPTGWNYAHATNCGWYLDGSGGQWFYIFPSEGGIIYYINNLYASQGLQVPCGEGYYIGWYVTNSNTGAYIQTESYAFK